MGSELVIVGSSPAVPRPNRANSCYLIRGPGATVVLELGSGALSKLLGVQDIAAIDALFISHMHADHFFDLVPLRYALKYEIDRSTPLPVLLPPGGIKQLHSVVSRFAKRGSFFDGLIALDEYDPAREYRAGGATLTFAKTRHYIPAYAMRVQLADAAIAFSSDTAPERRVIDLAQDANIFLCECGLGAQGTESGRRGHSNAREAGDMAFHARITHLVLTHYHATAGAADLERAARAAFSGRITVADDGMVIPA